MEEEKVMRKQQRSKEKKLKRGSFVAKAEFKTWWVGFKSSCASLFLHD
jgi:hypothetical protein